MKILRLLAAWPITTIIVIGLLPLILNFLGSEGQTEITSDFFTMYFATVVLSFYYKLVVLFTFHRLLFQEMFSGPPFITSFVCGLLFALGAFLFFSAMTVSQAVPSNELLLFSASTMLISVPFHYGTSAFANKLIANHFPGK